MNRPGKDKRGKSGSAVGRPAKARPPPHAWNASGSVPDLLRADDLPILAKAAGQSHTSNADLTAIVSAINELFAWHALWSAGQHKRAPPSEVRDWCKQLAKQARDLLHALGHDRDYLSSPSFKDAQQHLNTAWPQLGSVTGGPDRERHALYKIESITRRAIPERYEALERDRAENPARDAAWDCIGARLGMTLHLLQILSDRSAAYHAQQVRRGGSDPEEARKHLFCLLSREYERLFGHPPAVPSPVVSKARRKAGEKRDTLPGGPGFRWFRALLDLLGSRAKAMLEASKQGDIPLEAERDGLLNELIGLVAASTKGAAGDGLAHWIREGSADWTRRPPPCPEPVDPAPPPTPFEDLFG